MRIAIDIGCAHWGDDEPSVARLLEQYEPDFLFGFDPQVGEYYSTPDDPCPRIFSTTAAWTYEGFMTFGGEGPTAGVRPDGCPRAESARCFDFAAFLTALPATAEVIVKMDIEGGEYRLLEHLHDRGVLLRAKYLVEWHSGEYVNGTNGHEFSTRQWYFDYYGDLFLEDEHLARDFTIQPPAGYLAQAQAAIWDTPRRGTAVPF